MTFTKTLAYHGFTLQCPEPWEDVTDQVEGDNGPVTLADTESGVGALQFTAAIYKDGELPHMDEAVMREMLLEYAENLGLGPAIELTSHDKMPATAQASFHAEGDFVALWFLTDERSLVMATYVCEWENRGAEWDVVQSMMATVEVGDW